MIKYYLSNNNEICYSTKTQTFSRTKQGLGKHPQQTEHIGLLLLYYLQYLNNKLIEQGRCDGRYRTSTTLQLCKSQAITGLLTSLCVLYLFFFFLPLGPFAPGKALSVCRFVHWMDGGNNIFIAALAQGEPVRFCTGQGKRYKCRRN